MRLVTPRLSVQFSAARIGKFSSGVDKGNNPRCLQRQLHAPDTHKGPPLELTRKVSSGIAKSFAEETLMRFYTQQHPYYCGIDLHARSMYLCILDQAGQVVVHRNIRANPDAFLEAVAPYREDLVVAVECMFTWYWLADTSAAARRSPSSWATPST